MGRRSRLRSRSYLNGRLVGILVLAGILLPLGLYFFLPSIQKNSNDHFADGYRTGGDTTILLNDRGEILDRNYKRLAVTLDKVSVYANVREVDKDEVSEKLGPVLDKSVAEIRRLLDAQQYKVWLAKNISQQKEEKVINLNLHGVHLQRQKVRYYPQKESAAHVVGVVGKGLGLTGVEHTYNGLLNKSSTALLEDGARLLSVGEDENAVNQYLVLTIDLKIQQTLDKFVNELGQRQDDAFIGAMLMESHSGKIIGLANYPSYDPNVFYEAQGEKHRNILAEPIGIPPQIRKLLWDASLVQGHFEKDNMVLPWSAVANRRDIGSQLRLWENLGLNDPLATDFTTFDAMQYQKWYAFFDDEIHLYHDSVVDTATPLHLASAINSISQGGSQPIPHVIDRIVNKEGQVFQLSPMQSPEAVRSEVAREVRALLAAQLQPGPLASGQFETGFLSFQETAEGRRYLHNNLMFSLIPQEKPELMLFVFTQHPPFSPFSVETKSKFSIAASANQITVPMVAMHKVMSTLSDMMTIEEMHEMNFEMEKEIGQTTSADEVVEPTFAGTMPDLRGASLRKSLRMLGELKLEIQISGTGVVVEQEPAAGHLVPANSLCRLLLKPH